MRHASQPLAQLLRTSYAASTSRLEGMGVEPAAYRTLILPSGSRRGGRSVETTFSPDLQVSVLGQYDNLSAELGVNFRLKWIVQPGNEVFFIVNQGYDTSFDRFRPTENETSMKAAWTFRF